MRAAAISSGVGWAAGDAEVDGEHVLDPSDDLARVPEDAAAEGAVSERGDAAWLGHRLVGGEERRRASGSSRVR